jgi:hypothetical protein
MGPVLSICTDGADGATVRAPDDKESHRLEVSRELLKRIFACVDLDHSGQISREELRRFARMMGKTEEDIQEMFGAMDTDHSNSISEAEWLSFWLDWRYLQLCDAARVRIALPVVFLCCRPISAHQLQHMSQVTLERRSRLTKIFNAIAVNQQRGVRVKVITFFELRAFAEVALSETGDADSLLRSMDLDGDGVISILEWLTFWDKSLKLTEKTLKLMETAASTWKLRLLRVYNAVDKARSGRVRNSDLIAACNVGFAKDASSAKILVNLTRLLELYPTVSQDRWIRVWDSLALTDADLDEAADTLCAAHNLDSAAASAG